MPEPTAIRGSVQPLRGDSRQVRSGSQVESIRSHEGRMAHHPRSARLVCLFRRANMLLRSMCLSSQQSFCSTV